MGAASCCMATRITTHWIVPLVLEVEGRGSDMRRRGEGLMEYK
jgi:hypothetical protein